MANQDDSSSEETTTKAAAALAAANQVAVGTANSPFAKPAVPPRPRSILSDNSKKHNNLNNVMNAKNRNAQSTMMGAGHSSSSSGSSSNHNNSHHVGDQYAMDLMPSKEADLSNEKCKEWS